MPFSVTRNIRGIAVATRYALNLTNLLSLVAKSGRKELPEGGRLDVNYTTQKTSSPGNGGDSITWSYLPLHERDTPQA